MDMINLFGSPAGRAINEITSTKLNRSEHEMPRPNQKSNSNATDKQKTTSIQNEFVQLNLTKFNQSTNTTKITDKCTTVSNTSLLAKKVKFWKFFEENKCNNNVSSNADNSNSMNTTTTTTKCNNSETKK